MHLIMHPRHFLPVNETLIRETRLSRLLNLKLMSRLEFKSGAIAMRYVPR